MPSVLRACDLTHWNRHFRQCLRWNRALVLSVKLLTSLQPPRHRRPTGAANRGRDKAADREKDMQRGDELAILSELRNTNALAAKRYLEWLVVGRGLGRGGKETTEEGELFEELVWNCMEEVLEYVKDESVGKLWRAKGSFDCLDILSCIWDHGLMRKCVCCSGII